MHIFQRDCLVQFRNVSRCKQNISRCSGKLPLDIGISAPNCHSFDFSLRPHTSRSACTVQCNSLVFTWNSSPSRSVQNLSNQWINNPSYSPNFRISLTTENAECPRQLYNIRNRYAVVTYLHTEQSTDQSIFFFGIHLALLIQRFIQMAFRLTSGLRDASAAGNDRLWRAYIREPFHISFTNSLEATSLLRISAPDFSTAFT